MSKAEPSHSTSSCELAHTLWLIALSAEGLAALGFAQMRRIHHNTF
jgi:hypothetical protein